MNCDNELEKRQRLMEKSREAKRKQQERLDYLLREFKEDSVRYRDLEEGENYEEKRMLLRSLMNIRMPG